MLGGHRLQTGMYANRSALSAARLRGPKSLREVGEEAAYVPEVICPPSQNPAGPQGVRKRHCGKLKGSLTPLAGPVAISTPATRWGLVPHRWGTPNRRNAEWRGGGQVNRRPTLRQPNPPYGQPQDRTRESQEPASSDRPHSRTGQQECRGCARENPENGESDDGVSEQRHRRADPVQATHWHQPTPTTGRSRPFHALHPIITATGTIDTSVTTIAPDTKTYSMSLSVRKRSFLVRTK